MKATHTYLRGKSVFIVSLVVIGVTFLTVYFTGKNVGRSLHSNFYISVGIISASLFLFMTYGLYFGVGLIDNFPKSYKPRAFLTNSNLLPEMPNIDIGDGIGGLVASILLWIRMTILFLILLFFFEAIILFAVFIILGMLYWVFFRALRFVFKKSGEMKGKLMPSIIYSLGYTVVYIAWIVGIVYLTEVFS